MVHVSILMATYNGAPYLREQLDSILTQSHQNWSLWVSDDGSSDATWQILEDFQQSCAQDVHLIKGPQKGGTANFLSLLCNVECPIGMVALCDQDDVWFEFKLERAISQLSKANVGLYCGRSEIGFDPVAPTTLSPVHNREPSFCNALIQTIGGGNTMVMTSAAFEIVKQMGWKNVPAFHDWWIYLVISGAGGQVIYDETPVLFYRQHHDNQLGRNRGFAARISRLYVIFSGQYRQWVDKNILALSANETVLTSENREQFSRFKAMRRKTGFAARKDWRILGLYRQSRAETAVMAFAAMLRKI